MSVKKIVAVTSGCVALSFSIAALAEMSIPCGWYVEGNFGSSRITNRNSTGSTNSSGLGGNANVGYKFMPYFATEMGYTRYANTTVKTGAGVNAATISNYSYDLAGKGIFPFSTSGLEAFGKLGIERVNAHTNLKSNNAAAAASLGLTNSRHSASGLYWGIGLQYYFMPEMAINVQGAQAVGNKTTGTMNLASAGISFILG